MICDQMQVPLALLRVGCSDPLEDERDPLPDPYAHCAECITRLDPLQLVHRSGHQPRSAGPERVPQSDRAAVRVDAGIVILQPQVAKHRQALPAVTVPSGLTTPFNLARASSDVSRGCSSLATTTSSPFLCGIVTGVTSASRKPAFCAATAFSCEASAIRSWASRSMW